MKKEVFIFWSVFIAAAAFRLFQYWNVEPPDIGSCLKQSVSGSGFISEEPQQTSSGQVIIVSTQDLNSVDGQKCASNILIRLDAKLYPQFSYNQRISFSGKLSKPFNFSSDDGRTFDFQGYLAKDDVFYEVRAAKVEGMHDTDPQMAPSGDPARSRMSRISIAVSSFLFRIKNAFVHNLNRVLGEPQGALAAGLVVGEKASLGKDLLEDFRTVGLIHIIVLSGFNITIVAAAMRRMLSFLPRIWGIIIGGVGMVLFGVLVGGGATVVRSCFMGGIALSADIIRRDYNVLRALGFAALVMLIQNPLILLHDPSFQLSFLATLGLILLAGPIERRLGFIPDKFGMRGVIASTLATQIFVSPYILYMMGQISIIGAVVNILVLPFIPATMLFVFLTGSIGMISFVVSQFFGWIAHLLLSYELFMVEEFAKAPFAALHVGTFSGWYVVAFYLLLAAIKLFSIVSQLTFAKKSSM